MKWNIITDTSCDLIDIENEDTNITFFDVPFAIRVNDKDYIDCKELDTEDMMYAMKESRGASTTACPAPYSWYEKFQKDGNVIAITISKELSGSYNSAEIAKNMILENVPERKIVILNSFSTGPALTLAVYHIIDLIKKGLPFEEVALQAQEYIKNIHTAFALCSFDNLVKNGRISKIKGQLASIMNFWGIGNATDEGTINVKEKVRGRKKVISAIIEEMKANKLYGNKVVIAHCFNSDLAERLKCEIEKVWSSAETVIMQTRGLNSYYADMGGIIVSY